MIYSFRLWLSSKMFIYAKKCHPDIARLTKEIKEQQERMAEAYILAGIGK